MDPDGPGPMDPVPGTPTETREWYDHASGFYAGFVEDLEYPPTAVAIDHLEIGPGDRIIDLGCGAGRTVTVIAKRLDSDGRVLGVDFAPGMCRETRKSIEAAGVSERAGVVGGDITDLPVRDGVVDAAISSFVLDLLSPADIDAALQEIGRVLRPGGEVAVVSLADTEAGTSTVYRSLRGVFPTQLDCRPIPTVRLLDRGGFDVYWTTQYSLYGLPVTIALARNPAPGANGG